VIDGPTAKLKGELIDLQWVDLFAWTASHNRWSSAEAAERLAIEEPSADQLPGKLTGDRRMRKRWLKNNIWYRMPLFARPAAFFIYSYFLKLGFLDGTSGLVYHVLQAFWFRFLVDAKILEHHRYAQTLELSPTAEWLACNGVSPKLESATRN
jgi:hypothetical protein